MLKPLNAIDLFASCGGLSEGLKMAGFNVIAANEIVHDAAMTYKVNHPSTKMIEKDIRMLSAKEIIDTVRDKISIVAGGPPCQGFSMAGRRDLDDPRNFLFREFIRVVEKLSPKYFLMENVPGILSIEKGKFFSSIISSFEEIGYKTTIVLLDSSNFGVPQIRKRVFITGSNKKLNPAEIKSVKRKPVCVKDAIGDLDFLDNGEHATSYLKLPETEYQKKMRRNSSKLYNHQSSNHSKGTIKRFAFLMQGQSVSDLPIKLRTRKFALYRLDGQRPSRTLTTLPDDYVHYKKNRILTVREMARLQSFPDSYIFLGPRTTGGVRRKTSAPQYTQVGNAVPPFLAKAVGEWILGTENFK